jgi:hypothetical protein
MTQAPEPRPGPGKSKRVFLWGAGFLGVTLLLYVLSAGPALRLTQQRKLPTEIFETAYGPVMLVMDAVPGGGWIKRYVDWWALDDKAMGVGN